jgi:hypothetical protein
MESIAGTLGQSGNPPYETQPNNNRHATRSNLQQSNITIHQPAGQQQESWKFKNILSFSLAMMLSNW